jgi:hypothetical protein
VAQSPTGTNALFYGYADTSLRDLHLTVGDRSYRLTTSPTVIRVAVRDPGRLTPEGRALLEQMPDEIAVQTIAAVISTDALRSGSSLDPTVHSVTSDGREHVQTMPPSVIP